MYCPSNPAAPENIGNIRILRSQAPSLSLFYTHTHTHSMCKKEQFLSLKLKESFDLCSFSKDQNVFTEQENPTLHCNNMQNIGIPDISQCSEREV